MIMGSHCVALDAVIGRLADAGVFDPRRRSRQHGRRDRGSERGECDIAPVHLLDPTGGTYNRPSGPAGPVAGPGWRRMQGFVFRPDDARFAGETAQQALLVALADPAA